MAVNAIAIGQVFYLLNSRYLLDSSLSVKAHAGNRYLPLGILAVVRGYSYRQIITRPILGGGFMTALAVPLIARIGLPAFTIATAAVAGTLIAWGIKRAGRQG